MFPTQINATTTVPTIGVVRAQHNDNNARIIIGSAQTLVDEELQKNEDNLGRITKADVDYNRKTGAIKLSKNSIRSVLISRRFDRILRHGWVHNILIDECHHAVADGSLAIIRRLMQLRDVLDLPPLKIIGFTATPQRDDGRGLNNIFENHHHLTLV